MGNKKKSESGFLVQGSILAIASIISRIIGLLYRVPLTAIIGNNGNSYYSCAYEIYSMPLLISSYSLPMAVSKLVSARVAKGDFKNAFKVFKGAFLFAVCSGIVAMLIVFFGAEMITRLMKTPLSIFCTESLSTNAGGYGGIRRYAWILSGTWNNDAKCSFTDHRADHQRNCQRVGCISVSRLRKQGRCRTWKRRRLCSSMVRRAVH